MSLGSAIRNQRKSLNLTLQALANVIGADSGNLSRIERGEQGVTEAMLRKLCTALDCTPAFLYAQSEQNQPLMASEKIADNAIFNKQVLQTPSAQSLSRPQEFVSWFRSVAPYIHALAEKPLSSRSAVKWSTTDNSFLYPTTLICSQALK